MSGYTGGLGNSYLGNFGCGSCWVARWFGLSGAGRGGFEGFGCRGAASTLLIDFLFMYFWGEESWG